MDRVLVEDVITLLRWHPFPTRYVGHIKEIISVPFIHRFFKEKDLFKVYQRCIKNKYKNSPKIIDKINQSHINIMNKAVSFAELKMPMNLLWLKKCIN